MEITASDVVGLLSDAAFEVTVPADADLRITRDGKSEDIVLKLRRKTIYEWDAIQILETTPGRVLIAVPVASRGLLDTARRHPRLSVASVVDRRLIWNAEEIVTPDAAWRAQKSVDWRRRRNPWGRWAVMRALLRTDEPRSQVSLSKETGVSQPGVSKVLSAMNGLVVVPRLGWSVSDARALWDDFMAEYPGTQGVTTYWYGLEPVAEQAKSVASAAAVRDLPVLRSGDSAADELAPWRIPARAIVYARAGIELAKLGFAETSRSRATLEYTVPADHTIWATAEAWADGSNAATVDPVIAAWDVRRTGGPDVDEAVQRIRDLLVLRNHS